MATILIDGIPDGEYDADVASLRFRAVDFQLNDGQWIDDFRGVATER
jgi:hypothetical protein